MLPMFGGIALAGFDSDNEEGFQEREPKVVQLTPPGAQDLWRWDWQRHELPMRSWLVKDMLPEVGVAFLAGQSGVGKTHVAIDLAMAAILDTEFAGREICRSGAVLWLAAEAPGEVPTMWNGIRQAKAKSYLEQHGYPTDTALPFGWAIQVPQLTQPEALKRLAWMYQLAQQGLSERFPGRPVVLVVVDTLAAASAFRNADDAAEAQTVMNVLQKFATDVHALVLVIDHAGKDVSRGIRNSSAKQASADAVLMITGKEGTWPPEDLKLQQTKLRGGACNIVVPFELRQFDVPDPNEMLTEVSVVWEEQQKVDTRNKRIPRLMVALEHALGEHGKMRIPKPGMNPVLSVTTAELKASYRSEAARPDGSAHSSDPRTLDQAFRRAINDSKLKYFVGTHPIDEKSDLYWKL
jgi:hypothetical protein